MTTPEFRSRNELLFLCSLIVILASVAFGANAAARIWTFEDDSEGSIAAGFQAAAGNWVVVKTKTGKALEQTAANPNATFNLALVKKTHVKDLDLSVKIDAIAGKLDQGGGVVWRARDSKNYYIARYNPLEDNFRVYKVIDGKRIQLGSADDIPHAPGVHSVRAVMKGQNITCYYDEKKYLEVSDPALSEGGMIGVWSKSDARTRFDDLTLKPIDD